MRFLLAYLTAAVHDREELDVCVDHLTYRFGPKAEDAFGENRLSEIFSTLTEVELRAILNCFQYAYNLEEDFDGYCSRSISNVERALQSSNKSLHPTAARGGD